MGLMAMMAARSGPAAFRGFIAGMAAPLFTDSETAQWGIVGAAAGSGWGGRLALKNAAIGGALGLTMGTGYGGSILAGAAGAYAGYHRGGYSGAATGAALGVGGFNLAATEPVVAIGGAAGALWGSKFGGAASTGPNAFAQMSATFTKQGRPWLAKASSWMGKMPTGGPVIGGAVAGALIASILKRGTEHGAASVLAPAGMFVGGVLAADIAQKAIYSSIASGAGAASTRALVKFGATRTYYTGYAAAGAALWGGAQIMRQEAFGSVYAPMAAQARSGIPHDNLNTSGLGLGLHYAYNRAKT